MTKASSAESRVGAIIDGRYRIDAVLGAGGFGAVYRARHLELDHEVALKLLHEGSGDKLAKRLAREAKTLARLDHPNCVRVLDFGTHEDTAYLAMERVDGEPLSASLGQPWPQRQALERTIELLAGLAHAHALGLVHRDLKPANVLLGTQLKIIDFGIVAIAAGEQLASFTEQLTATGKIIGTPRYMSPEQLLGAKVDARSDLYAVGLLLYEMLAGQPAFASADPRELAWRHAVAPPPLLPDEVDDELAEIVGRLLAKKPAQRPASAELLRELLQARLAALEQRAPSPLETAKTLAPSLAELQPHPTELEATATTPTLLTQALEPSAPGPGTRAGRFTLLRELGRGAMGVVYLGWDETLDRQAAVKLLRPGLLHGHAHQRMLREARGLARVEHPNVVGVLEFGAHADQLFVAMEYVPGRTLRAWLDEDEHEHDWRERLARVIEAGRGLAAVHTAGLVHRDFKPDNVLVGEDERARVVDFGLVRAVSPAFDMVDRLAGTVGETQPLDPLALKLTRTGAIIGTPAYMALEQLAGDQVDARTDQFAFCVVAYEALYGRRPFVGNNLEDLAAKLTAGQLEPRPEHSPVPVALDEVLARGLQIMPASRWANMDALLDALEQAADARPKLPKWAWVAGCVGLVGLALASLAWIRAGEGARPSADSDAETAPAATLEPGPAQPGHASDNELLRARLARAYPRQRGAWLDVMELAARSPQPMSLELRAAIHTLAGAVHQRDFLRELGKVELLAWAPEQPLLALALDGGGLALWDAETRELARELATDQPLEALRFSPDAQLLAGHARGAVYLWHVSTGTQLARLEQPGADFIGFVADASAAPTPSLVIGSDTGVSLWSLVRGKELERKASILASGARLALASAGARVLAVSERGIVSTWTPSEQAIDEVALEAFDDSQPERGQLFVSPDAAHILRATGSELELWDARTGTRRVIDTLGPCSGALAFAPDAQSVAVGRRARPPLHVELSTGERIDTAASAPVEARGLGLDARGRLLTLTDGGQLEIATPRGAAFVPGLARGRVLALAPSSNWVALLDDEGVASVWASVSVAERAAGPLPAGEPPPSSPRVSLSGAWPTRIELRSSEGLARTLELDGELRACAVSADEALLACAGVGPSVQLWSLADGTRSRVLHLDEHELHALSFSPNGKQLAVAGRELHLWDLDAGAELARAETTLPVEALRFRSEGQALELNYADGRRGLRLVDEQALLDALCRADLELAATLSACES